MHDAPLARVRSFAEHRARGPHNLLFTAARFGNIDLRLGCGLNRETLGLLSEDRP